MRRRCDDCAVFIHTKPRRKTEQFHWFKCMHCICTRYLHQTITIALIYRDRYTEHKTNVAFPFMIFVYHFDLLSVILDGFFVFLIVDCFLLSVATCKCRQCIYQIYRLFNGTIALNLGCFAFDHYNDIISIDRLLLSTTNTNLGFLFEVVLSTAVLDARFCSMANR